MSRYDEHSDKWIDLRAGGVRGILIFVCAVAIVLASASSRALALTQRGHEYSFSFASRGSGEGELSDPAGVAVDEATGDVYVVDRANNRIEQFSPQVGSGGELVGYKFVSAWGWGVKTEGSKSYEVCKSGEGCKAGTPGTGKGLEKFKLGRGQLVSPTAIAVDNCTTSSGETCTSAEDPSVGDVYVVADQAFGKTYVYKLGSEGEYKERLTNKEEAEEYEGAVGVAVDSHGEVWVEWSGSFGGHFTTYTDEANGRRVKVRNANGELEVQAPIEAEPEVEPLRAGFGLDSEDNLYITHEEPEAFEEAANEESPYSEEGRGEHGEYPCEDEHAPCLAAKLLGVERPGNKEGVEGHELKPGEALIEEPLDPLNTTGIAVSPAASTAPGNDVYLDNVTSVSVLTPTGSLIQSFGSAASEPGASAHLEAGSGIALDSRSGAQDGYVYVADAATGQVDVFKPEAPSAPSIEALSAQEVSSEAAQLDATIDPRGAKPQTSWYFEYGAGLCPGSCTRVPGGQFGGEDFGDEGFGEQEVSIKLGTATSFPLSSATTYHYRVVAENTEHGQTISAQGSFSTPAAKGKFIADEREWEMVSPPDKEGADVDPVGLEFPGPIQAAADGSALAYIANGPFAEPEGNRSLETTQIVSTRGEAGWASKDIVTPNSAGTGLKIKTLSEYKLFSSNLALALLVPYQGGGELAEPPLSPALSPAEEGHQEKTIYLRDDRPIAPQGELETGLYDAAAANGTAMGNPGYLALLTGADAPGAQFGGEDLRFADATPDLSQVVLESKAPLQAGEAEEGLYEWSRRSGSEGTIEPVNTLEPGTKPKTFLGDARLGGISAGGPTTARNLGHAISADGSRVFWTSSPSGLPKNLYMRDLTKAPQPETIQLDRVQLKASGAGPEHAVFQAASADGSRVFFTDEQALTEGSGATEGEPDLYVCEIFEDTSHKLECTLTDLTPKSASGESANVQDGGQSSSEDIGGVLGSSEDGSTVYFIANGVLSNAPNAQEEEASPGHCGHEGYPHATCNLYSEHYNAGSSEWEAPRFVAALSSEDEPDWAGAGQGRLTSRVSPNGVYLAFMSERPLTSFDGQRYSTAATGMGANGAPAEEVYEYDSQTGQIVCASCEPSGGRPVGVLDPSRANGAPSEAGLLVDMSGHWAGRWLAGSLPEWPGISQNGEQAVYENRVLSNSGRLFFDSPEALVPEDKNDLEDVYEYEPQGVPRGRHRCTSASATFSERSQGCIGLISSGTSSSESAFLDASESGGEGEAGEELAEGGGDVFFVTAEKLSPRDIDGDFDAYDAHECTAASPCYPEREVPATTPCASAQACRPYSNGSAPTYGAPTSAGAGAAGNLTPGHAVLPSKASVKPKRLTRAQRLAKALKHCRAERRHSKQKRQVCERQARRRYAPVATKRKVRK